MMLSTPPQLSISWDRTVEALAGDTNGAIERLRAALDRIGSIAPKDCSFDTVFVAIDEEERAFNKIVEPILFYQNVSESQELRDASSEADSLVRDFRVESSMRMDVFLSKAAAERNIREIGQWEKLSTEERRLVEKMILDGTRAGLALPADKREELISLKKELSQVCLEYLKNFNEEKGGISFTEDELKGVPKDTISGYLKTSPAEGKAELYAVTFKSPDTSPILGFAEIPETRKRVYEGNQSRLFVNVPIIAKAIELRRQIAGLLGYRSWADYVTEDRMIKSGKAVEDFLTDLKERLLPIGLTDRENLLAMKKQEHMTKSLPFDGKYYLWDHDYYERKFTEEMLDFDSNLVKEYFPVSTVVPSILDIYQNLFKVKFEVLNDASTWHPDVQAYGVWEMNSENETDFIGYCYLDLHPRPGKFSHVAVWPLIPGHGLPDGKRSYPVCAMVANVPKSTPDKPALMPHNDVVTFFHEMGHVFHEILSKTKYSRFHGTSGALDFVEAPSQMLENWCWEGNVLQLISSHYQTGKPLSPDLAEKLVKSRYTNAGLYYLRQVFYATFDLKIHFDQDQLDTPEDYTHLWSTLCKEILTIDYDKELPSHGAISHFASGYDVGLYGYIYSLVFAADMYATIFKDDPLDPGRARLYREKILLPGSSRDEIDILKDLLGRPPNSEAFSKQIFGTL